MKIGQCDLICTGYGECAGTYGCCNDNGVGDNSCPNDVRCSGCIGDGLCLLEGWRCCGGVQNVVSSDVCSTGFKCGSIITPTPRLGKGCGEECVSTPQCMSDLVCGLVGLDVSKVCWGSGCESSPTVEPTATDTPELTDTPAPTGCAEGDEEDCYIAWFLSGKRTCKPDGTWGVCTLSSGPTSIPADTPVPTTVPTTVPTVVDTPVPAPTSFAGDCRDDPAHTQGLADIIEVVVSGNDVAVTYKQKWWDHCTAGCRSTMEIGYGTATGRSGMWTTIAKNDFTCSTTALRQATVIKTNTIEEGGEYYLWYKLNGRATSPCCYWGSGWKRYGPITIESVAKEISITSATVNGVVVSGNLHREGHNVRVWLSRADETAAIGVWGRADYTGGGRFNYLLDERSVSGAFSYDDVRVASPRGLHLGLPPGEYKVWVDSLGDDQCSGYPFGLPAGWAECSGADSETILVPVTEPTVGPTVEPTVEPTAEPTGVVPVLPTARPTDAPGPTNTPVVPTDTPEPTRTPRPTNTPGGPTSTPAPKEVKIVSAIAGNDGYKVVVSGNLHREGHKVRLWLAQTDRGEIFDWGEADYAGGNRNDYLLGEEAVGNGSFNFGVTGNKLLPPGEYKVWVDSLGDDQCSGYPWGLPSGWAKCSADDADMADLVVGFPGMSYIRICGDGVCKDSGQELEVGTNANIRVDFTTKHAKKAKVRWRLVSEAGTDLWRGGYYPPAGNLNDGNHNLSFTGPLVPGEYQVGVAAYTEDCNWACSNQRYFTDGSCGDGEPGVNPEVLGSDPGCDNDWFLLTVEAGTPTPTNVPGQPTNTPVPTNTSVPSGCPVLEGTLAEAEFWRSEYVEGGMGTVERNNWRADFVGLADGTCDGFVDIDDFEAWRAKYEYNMEML